MNEHHSVMDRDMPKVPMTYSLHSLAWDYCEGQDNGDVASGSFQKRSELMKPSLKTLDLPNHDLLEKVKNLQERIDADMCEMKKHKSEPDDLVAAYTIKKDSFMEKVDRDVLVVERDALLREKKDLENLLVDAGKKLLEAAQTVKEAEHEAAATKTLNSDVERLCKLSTLLSDENTNLRSKIATDEAYMEDLKFKKEIVEKEIEKLRLCSSEAFKEVDCLKETVLIMQAAAARMKEDNDRLENLLQKVSEKSLGFENENKDLHLRVESLEGMISEMQNDLYDARFESQKLSHDLQKELTSKEALLEGFSFIHKSKESPVSEILTKTEDEMTKWREKVEGLEAALLEANDMAYTSEKKAWQLLSELKSVKMQVEKKPKAASYTIPATAVSSVLAAVCIIAYVKAYQPGMPAR